MTAVTLVSEPSVLTECPTCGSRFESHTRISPETAPVFPARDRNSVSFCGYCYEVFLWPIGGGKPHVMTARELLQFSEWDYQHLKVVVQQLLAKQLEEAIIAEENAADE